MRGFHILLAVAIVLLVSTSEANSVFRVRNPSTSEGFTTQRLLSKVTTATDIDDSSDEDRASLPQLEQAVKSSTAKLRAATLNLRSKIWLQRNLRPDKLFEKLSLSGKNEYQLLGSNTFLKWVKYSDEYAQKLKSKAVGENVYLVLQEHKLSEHQISKIFESLEKISGYETIATKFQNKQFSNWYWTKKVTPKKLLSEGEISADVVKRYETFYNKIEASFRKDEMIANPGTRYKWLHEN